MNILLLFVVFAIMIMLSVPIGVSLGKDTYKDTEHEMNPHFSGEEAAEMVASGLISVQSHTSSKRLAYNADVFK